MTFTHHGTEAARVLVAHASRHGSTAEIADRIAERLRAAGLYAVSIDVGEVDEDPESYDAFVIGGAVYLGHLLKPLVRFAERHEDVLAARPVWLFSSGPLGDELVDEEGRDVLAASRPVEFADLHERLEPSGERVFFGRFDPDAPPIGLVEHAMRLAPARRDALPSGDFRDWTAIDAWADTIADALVWTTTGRR